MEKEEKGILVEQVVQADRLKYQGKLHEQLFLALRFLYLLLGTVGVALAFADAIDIPVNHAALIFGLIVFCLLFTVIWHLPLKKRYVWLALILLYLLLGIVFGRVLISGFTGCYNQYAQQVNEYYNSKLPLVADAVPSQGEYLFFILYILFLLCGLLSVSIIRSLDGRLTVLVMAVPVVLSLAVGLTPPMSASVLMTAVLIGIFSLQYTRYRDSFSVRTVTVRMGGNMFAKLRWQTAALAALLFLLILPVGALGLGPVFTEGYEAQSSLREDIRNGDIIKSMQDFWKKTVRGEWDWLPFDIIRSSGVHGGKLSNVKEVRDYDETHLYLDISSDLDAPMYIRAYVGSQYTGKGWKELSSELNEQGLATGQDLITLSNQYFDVLQELYDGQDGSVVRRDLVISVADANSAYSYIPYGSELSGYEAGVPFDAYPKEDLDREILTMYYLNTQRVSNINKLAEAGAYSLADAAYRDFARQVYLELPEEGLDRFYQEYSGRQFTTVGECVSFVRDTLEEHAEYTKSPGATHGMDYVEYFLYENKNGVCTHFASAAVLLFRLYGIPARYVEGYFTTGLDAGQGAQEIKDSQAHAWPEIYIDGAGWIPVEVTPGFIRDEDLNDRTDTPDSDIDHQDIEDVTKPAEETVQETQEPETMEAVYPTTEAAQPTQATQPTRPSSSPQQTQDDGEGSSLWSVLRVFLAVLLLLILAAAAVLAIRYQRKIRLRKQEEIFRGDPETAIRYAFRHLDELCRSEHVPQIEEAADAMELQKVFPAIGEDTLYWTQSLMQELTFSNHVYDSMLRDQVVKLYRDVAAQAVEGCSHSWRRFFRKLWYLYGRCYC